MVETCLERDGEAMKHPIFHVGERCYIAPSNSAPGYSRLECEITGALMSRPVYDERCQLIGYSMAYKVKADDLFEEVCAPEHMLRKKWQRSDWRALKCNWYGETRQIWQPKREAR